MSLPKVTLTNSLQKVLPGRAPSAGLDGLSGWLGQRLSFQVAWLPPVTNIAVPSTRLRVQVTGGKHTLYAVDLVPAQVPCWPDHGDGYLVELPTMLPDVLRELGDEPAAPTHVGWHSVWVDVVPETDLTVQVFDGDQLVLDERVPVQLVARPAATPELSVAQWFHADALAQYYDVETWRTSTGRPSAAKWSQRPGWV